MHFRIGMIHNAALFSNAQSSWSVVCIQTKHDTQAHTKSRQAGGKYHKIMERPVKMSCYIPASSYPLTLQPHHLYLSNEETGGISQSTG